MSYCYSPPPATRTTTSSTVTTSTATTTTLHELTLISGDISMGVSDATAFLALFQSELSDRTVLRQAVADHYGVSLSTVRVTS
eukprot:14804221-Heterocapsa_arctica.AAC.1